MPKRFLGNSKLFNTIDKINNYWRELKPSEGAASGSKEKWLNQASLFEQLSYNNSVAISLWDVAENRIIYLSDKKNILGHNIDNFLDKNGINFTLSNIHPHYFDALMLMQKETFGYCTKYSSHLDLHKVMVNMDFLYKRADNTYFHMLRQMVCVETGSNGQPALILSYLHDISHLKKTGTANLVITSPAKIEICNFNFAAKKLERVNKVTQQEKNILLLLSQGKDSKTLAGELHLSTHTIDTHRRNLLKKTNCIDTTALVTYARIVGMI